MQSTWADAFRAVFYGPSWRPGSPRTGADVDKVDVSLEVVVTFATRNTAHFFGGWSNILLVIRSVVVVKMI